jgi:hypothetical protein
MKAVFNTPNVYHTADFSLQWKNFPVKDATRSIAIDNHYPGRPRQYRADIDAIPLQPDGALFSVSFSIDSVLGYQVTSSLYKFVLQALC